METACFFATMVCTYKSTWRYNPEDQHRHIHRRENLKSHIIILIFVEENDNEASRAMFAQGEYYLL
jgi:hypothetical protein